MDLYRLGGAAVRLGKILSIREDTNDPEKGPRVLVYFEGKRVIPFEGEDAIAFREYVRGLPSPPPPDAAPTCRPRADSHPARLDPRTGLPLADDADDSVART